MTSRSVSEVVTGLESGSECVRFYNVRLAGRVAPPNLRDALARTWQSRHPPRY